MATLPKLADYLPAERQAAAVRDSLGRFVGDLERLEALDESAIETAVRDIQAEQSVSLWLAHSAFESAISRLLSARDRVLAREFQELSSFWGSDDCSLFSSA
jgi:hypothetical protein